MNYIPARFKWHGLFSRAAIVLVGAASFANQSSAQSTSPETAGETGEVVKLDQYVVSGTVAPKRRIEDPAAVTTIDADQIKMSVPRGAPELIKLVPGVYVESAGGETRANVYTRGIPQAGGYTFAGLQEDGLPVISETMIRNLPPDLFTRLTAYVSRVESVRGGTSGVFQNNAPGGVINFIGREGTAMRQGEVGLQLTDYNQIKGELWLTGPTKDENTTYAFYAGYRKDDGQRRTGYTADLGGSVIGNIKHQFKDGRGYIKFSGKWMDERNVFYFPIPLKGAKNPQTIPGGPDILKGTTYSADLRRGVSIPSTPDGPLNPDLADGGHVPLAYIGADLDLKLVGDLKLRDLARYTKVNFNQAIALPSSVATPLQSLANSIGAGAGGQFAAANAGGTYRYRLSYPGLMGVAIADPTTLNGNGLGLLLNEVTSFYHIGNIQNDLRLQQTTDHGGTYTAGLYASEFKLNGKQWNHTIVTDVSPSAHRLDFEYLDATTGASLGYGTYQGARQISTASYRNNSSTQRDLAPYFDASQTIGSLTLDAGVRREDKREQVTVAVPQTYNLNPAGQNNPALRNAVFGSGSTFTQTYDLAATVWTVAANYAFTRQFSAYARWTSAYRMPISDDFMTAALARSTNPGPINRVRQAEVGLKYSTRKFAIFPTLVVSGLKNQLFAGNIAQPDGSLVAQNFFRDTKGVSFEVEAFYSPIKNLTFHVVGTLQRQRFANDVTVSGVDSTGKAIVIDINGNRVVRIPDRYGIFSTVYKITDAPIGRISANFDVEYTGLRAGDEANRTWLPSYTQCAAGLSLAAGKATYRLQVQNLFNRVGFTEGDPRTAQLVGDPNAAYANGRTIFPRSIAASVTYSF